MIPGEYFLKADDVLCNEGREAVAVQVTNTGDRPIQVGSHFHFFEVNRMLSFDREKAFGKRLNIIASTAVRFEPGEVKEVYLVEYAGGRKIYGHNDLVNGDTETDASKVDALKRAEKKHFKNTK